MGTLEKKIEKILSSSSYKDGTCPAIFDCSQKNSRDSVEHLIETGKITNIIDNYADQEHELSMVKDPRTIRHSATHKTEAVKSNIQLDKGVWVYFPWRDALVHCLDENKFQTLRTSRNKNLITETEQEQFRKFRIGIVGLSVGNPAALCITLEGGGKEMKFADNDILSITNFNRFNTSLSDIGTNKAVLSAKQCYEIDPFLMLTTIPEGITMENIDDFFLKPKLDLLIEEMDNLKLKIVIREKAKKYRIPVIMVTGNGPNLILDVERYDKDEDLPILNGHLQNEVIDKINGIRPGSGTFNERVLLARDFIGKDLLVQRLQDSFSLVGEKLASIPQLAEATFLRGATLTYVTRRLATGKATPSGRYFINLDGVVDDYVR